jgi:hypothetical protein
MHQPCTSRLMRLGCCCDSAAPATRTSFIVVVPWTEVALDLRCSQ